MKKYYIIYKITNLINNYIYIGAHSTDNINDNYMGSSKHLKKDFIKFDKSNFIKEILFIFNNKEDMLNKEKELVNREFCFRDDTYNRIVGGSSGSFSYEGMTTVQDKNGNILKVYINDPRYLSGDLISISKNKVTVKDKDGKTARVNKNDPRYLSGELVFEKTGKVNVKDKDGKCFCVDKNDPRYLSGEFVHVVKNTVTTIDNNGNIQQVNKEDPRYLSGELQHNLKNTIVVKDKDGNRFCVDKNDPRYLSGELVGWAKGRPGIKGMLGKNVTDKQKNHLSELAKLRTGNKSSTFGKIRINNGINNKCVLPDELNNYLDNGWVKGIFKK